MDQIYLRGLLEEDVVRALATRAQGHGRSLREEIKRILSREASEDRALILERLSEKRKRLASWNIFEDGGPGPTA